ncbi:PREDICTED: UPF0746 protein DDB_G0281095-like [Acromyrmex echinatior]|uniref:UPF0746 protein DDB_G0281095-like n=1 Tax=Acromyrmex echinatior TaxID=103372 RepID=UPI0005810897|nr:PREDICTED: UPF0746 protein DDB_G0281095-like [Acromyrmex echinatior]
MPVAEEVQACPQFIGRHPPDTPSATQQQQQQRQQQQHQRQWRQGRGTPPGVSVVQANARMPVSNENVEKGRERRIADGEIKKERVSYYRDNWRDSNGQSEQGGKKGEIEAPTQHPKTNPAILEIGTWNSGPRRGSRGSGMAFWEQKRQEQQEQQQQQQQQQQRYRIKLS